MLLDAAEGRKLVYELSVINFWYQIMALDELADSTLPMASGTVTQAVLMVARAQHRCHRIQLMHAVFGTHQDPFMAIDTSHNPHFASGVWVVHLPTLKAFKQIMDSWPGEKHTLWNCNNDPNLLNMPAEGFLWKKVLVQFYVQTYYNFIGFPPILPCCR